MAARQQGGCFTWSRVMESGERKRKKETERGVNMMDITS
jgi:hypothetical protein